MDIFMALTFLTKGLKEHITTPQTNRETVADFYVVYPFLNICQFLIVYTTIVVRNNFVRNSVHFYLVKFEGFIFCKLKTFLTKLSRTKHSSGLDDQCSGMLSVSFNKEFCRKLYHNYYKEKCNETNQLASKLCLFE